jgi:cytochrome c oxidase subunit II
MAFRRIRMAFRVTRVRTGLGTLALAAFAVLRGIAQDTSPVADGVKMTAVKYNFDPTTVRAKKGEHVKLVITALDRDHGFKLEAFHIEQKLPKGVAVTVEFVADQAGTFPFQCSVFCGLGHKKMKGELIVD